MSILGRVVKLNQNTDFKVAGALLGIPIGGLYFMDKYNMHVTETKHHSASFPNMVTSFIVGSTAFTCAAFAAPLVFTGGVITYAGCQLYNELTEKPETLA